MISKRSLLKLFIVLLANLSIGVAAYGQGVVSAGVAATVAGGGKEWPPSYAGPAQSAALHSPGRLAVDSFGNLYIAEAAGKVVRVIASGKGPVPALPGVNAPVAGSIYTLAGVGPGASSCAVATTEGCVATQLALGTPRGVAVDDRGNVYISDWADEDLLVVYASGKVPGLPAHPVRGNIYLLAGVAGVSGNSVDPAQALTAQFHHPEGLSVDKTGNLFIADSGNHRVRVLYAGGTVVGIPENAAIGNIYTIAGSWSEACEHATDACGDGGPAIASLLATPDAVTVDGRGNIYISDNGDARLRIIAAGGALPGIAAPVPGYIYTLAGNGHPGIAQESIAANESPLSAVLGQVAVDVDGNIYIPDSAANAVRKLGTDGTLHLLFGQSDKQCAIQSKAPYGDGCSSLSAQLAWPEGVVIDAAGHLYIADTQHQRIRTIAQGAASAGVADNSLTVKPQPPAGIPASATLLKTLRNKLHAQDLPSLTPGNIASIVGGPGVTVDPIPPAPANTVRANNPQFIALDGFGNIYFSTTGNNDVEVLVTSTTPPPVLVAEGTASPQQDYVYQIAGGSPACQSAVGSCGDGGPAVAQGVLNVPEGIALDAVGDLFIADAANNAIRKVSAAHGTITSVAGSPFNAGYSPDGTAATSALLNYPGALYVDAAGNIYFSEQNTSLVRVIYEGGTVPTYAGSLTASDVGKIFTIAGVNGNFGYNGDDIAANTAYLSFPSGITLDGANNLYIADGFNNLIRMVKAADQTITTVAGDASGAASGSNYCAAAPCGDGGPATSAQLSFPVDVKLDAVGSLFISDNGDVSIREVLASSGTISAVAGQEQVSGYSGDGGAATSATLNNPFGIALDSGGNLYIADGVNGNTSAASNAIREVGSAGGVVLKPQTITFPAIPNATYGTMSVTLGATSDSGLAVTYTIVSGPAVVDASGTALTLTGAGTVKVEADQTGNHVYAPAAPVTQSFTVNPAVLTVTANDFSLAVGTTVNTANFSKPYCTVSGLVKPDTVSGDCAITTTATGTPPVGTSYPITPTLGTLAVSAPANYVTPFTFVAGKLSITGNVPQTITFPSLPNTTFAWGTAPIPLNATSTSGLPITYTATGSATVTGSGGTGYTLTFTGIGPGSVTASQNGNNQYAAATSATQVFNVTPIVITVTANNITLPFGSTINASQLTYTIAPTQLVNGDVLTGTPALSTTATSTSPVGTTYPIAVAQGTLKVQLASSTGFYVYSFVPGVLTIGGGTQTIAFPAPISTPFPTPTYGSSSYVTLNASASSGLPVTYTFTGAAALSNNGTILTSGSTFTATGQQSPLLCVDVGTVTVTATQAGNGTFAAAQPATQTITVGPYPLLVALNPSTYTRAVGGDNPTFNYTVGVGESGVGAFQFDDTYNATTVQGVPDITTTATPDSPAGTYPITLSLGTLVSPSGRYTFTFQGGTLDVTPPPAYILTANPSTLTIATGHSQQTTVIAQGITTDSTYQGTLALSCSGLPAGATCTFSPSSLTLVLSGSGTSQNTVPTQTTLTINTNPNSPVAELASPDGRGRILPAALFFVPCSILGLLITMNRRQLLKKMRTHHLLLLLLLLTGLMGIGACGGGSSSSNNAQPGTSTVMVTATATGTAGTGSPNMVVSIPLTINITK